MNVLTRYFNYRQSLIDQYIKGDMTKSEYLEKNLDAVLGLNIKPFKNIDTLEKGLFNYQYFNALAKESRQMSYDFSDREIKYEYMEKADYYHDKKDKATLKIIELLDYKGIEAYYIKVRSKNLKGKLFEIIINDYNNMILHSTNDYIAKRLKDNYILSDTEKKSIIDGYINQKYWQRK